MIYWGIDIYMFGNIGGVRAGGGGLMLVQGYILELWAHVGGS